MPSPAAAEEHLRVIRSLMEKATIYRAIAAQGALIGGLVSLLAGGLLAGKNDFFVNWLTGTGMLPANADLFGFLMKWALVLLCAATANFYYLFRDARRRKEPFVSPGMRLALRAMTPALLCGLVFTSFCTRDGLPHGSAFLYDMSLPQAWMIFYGLALLSTSHFAPKSLVGLGWAFLLSGLALLRIDAREWLRIPHSSAIPLPGDKSAIWTYADALMACSFGFYHLVYALFTTSRKPEALEASV